MANNLKKDLLLVEVELTQGESVLFTFFNEEDGGLYPVVWNFRKYDPVNKKWNPSAEQEEKVAEWAKEHFGVEVAELANLGDTGVRKDVYHYDEYNSLWENKNISKMPKERVGEILTVTITEIDKNASAYIPKFEEDGLTYGVGGFKVATYLKSQNKWFPDPVKANKSESKFKDYFGVSVEQKDALIGEEMMVEIKPYRDDTWIEVKKFPEAKKEKMKQKAGK